MNLHPPSESAPPIGPLPQAGTLRFGSSLRSRPAAETIALAQPFMARLGISRVTQITRMDKLGLPVFTSVRPEGKVLRVHSGKGMQEIDAQVGALMEAIEFAIVEPQATTWQMETCTVGALARQLPPGMRFADFSPRTGLQFSAQDTVPALKCEEINSQRRYLVPAQLVFMPFMPETGPNLFGTSSNGLASGNSVDEATLHALFEILERDACAMNRPRDESAWVRPESLPEPFASLSLRWKMQGVELMVRHIPSEFELPCFQAVLHEAHSETVAYSGGYGLHGDAEIALSRAVCEAAQSRVVVIHGGREDITQFYEKYNGMVKPTRSATEATQFRTFTDQTRSIDFSAKLSSTQSGGIAEQLQQLLQRLRERGFHQVFRHVFQADLPNLAVVRIIVPRCEHVGHGLQRIGSRLMQRITDHA